MATYFLYFLIYAGLGWIMEVICQWITEKKWINRGFLLGPICPIYGYGVLGMIFLIGKDTTDFLEVFLKAIFICSILEYFTSYIMEKLFQARWWDYSEKKFNINGRVCLETMLPFGILGSLIIYIVHPNIVKLVSLIPKNVQLILATILFVLFLIDNLISFNVMSKIKNEITKQAVDNTELVKKKVMEWLASNSILYRHIKKAYPKFKIHNSMLKQIIERKKKKQEKS